MIRIRGALGLVLALGGCERCTPSRHPEDAGDAGRGTFVCGAPPVCPSGAVVPSGVALVRDIRARLAQGDAGGAATLVACARARGDEVTIEADPGFDDVTLSPDGARAIASSRAEHLTRVFDAKTGLETMRFADSAGFRATNAGLAVIAPTQIWSLDDEAPFALAPAPSEMGASKHGGWIWVRSGDSVLLARAEQVKKSGFDGALRVPIPARARQRIEVDEIDDRHLLLSERFVIDAATGATLVSLPDAVLSVVLPGAVVMSDKPLLPIPYDERYPPPARIDMPLVVPLSGKPSVRLTDHGCEESVALAASPDGATLVSSATSALCIFDVPSRKLRRTLPATTERALAAAFVGNARIIVIGPDGSPLLYDVSGRDAVKSLAPGVKSKLLTASGDPVLVALAGSGKSQLLEVHADGSHVARENIDAAARIGALHDATRIESVAFTDAGELEVVTHDGTLVACPLPNGRCRVGARAPWDPPLVALGSGALSPDGTFAASTKSGGTMEIVEVDTNTVTRHIPLDEGQAPQRLAVANGGHVAAAVVTDAIEKKSELLVLDGPEYAHLTLGDDKRVPVMMAAERHGYLALRFADHSAWLVDPKRRVWEISRAATDDGLWLSRGKRVVPLGEVRGATPSLACRIGSSIFPAAACLPSMCDSSL